jgi:uncharacterized protein YrrD
MNDKFNQENEPFQESKVQERPVSTQEPHRRQRGSAQVFQVGGDEQDFTTQSIKGRAIVSIQNGKKIGSVSDVVVDADKLEVAGLVLSKGTLFDRESLMIPAEQVQVWGQDVILVRSHDLPQEQMTVPEGKRWIYTEDNLRGRYVVSVDGKRIGQINDIIISPDGKLQAYQLSQVYVEGPLQESKRINASSTHSLGEDVLIVNSVQDL